MPDLLGKDLAQSSDAALRGYLRGLLDKKYRLGQELQLTERRIEKVRDEMGRRQRLSAGTTNDASEWQKVGIR
jgi:hypothetical protein